MKSHGASIIGLGVMGQRMLNNMSRYAGFDAVCAWDPDPGARERTATRYPRLRMAASAADAIADPRARVVYIASPPLAHREHALAALDAGKAVWCEKPLGVDVDESLELADRASASGLVNIVNFSLASAAATAEIERWMAAGEHGELVGIDVLVHFSSWPRDWQMNAAGWLAYRAEGGFTREVLSHWVYLTERLLGRARLERAFARYPSAEGAETHLHAMLRVDALPVSIAGSVGGTGPDRVEYTLWGSRSSCQIRDWNRLFHSDGGEWRAMLEQLSDPRETGYERQLANAAAAVAGEAHSMPDFRAALSVQVLIESMLSGERGSAPAP